MVATARDAIIESAFRLFLERGYDATSLARILESVPYSKGAVYHHFANKEALLDAVIEQFFTAQLASASACRPTDALGLAHLLVDEYVNAIDAVAPFATPLAYYTFLSSVAARAGDAIRTAHDASTAELAAAIRSHGVSAPQARLLARDLIALIEGTGMLAVLGGGHPDRDELHAAADRLLSLTAW